MRKALTIGIISVVVILLGFGVWLLATTDTDPPSATSQQTSEASTTPSENGITIIFTDNGFEQQDYSVTAGQTVTVKNESSIEIKFSSDEHPTHTDNPELNMGALDSDEQTTFTPDTAGEWGIHDHEHPEFTATLTVTD